MNPVSAAYTLAYEVSPIWFTGGIASLSPVGIPMAFFTQPLASAGSIINAISSNASIDLTGQPFFTWRPLPGATIWESEIAEYPFYTNQIAANAQVQKPLRVSMLGHCPAGKDSPFTIKLATLQLLQTLIQNHCNSGGTFTVFTPSYTYFNCLLTNFIDVSTGESNQAQVSWQLDFVQPLLTFPGDNGALNSLTSAMYNGGTLEANSSGAIPLSGAQVVTYPYDYSPNA
jgi:hypothetical protein